MYPILQHCMTTNASLNIDKSLVEACVGMSIACMPATAAILKATLPPYKSIRSSFFSKRRRLRQHTQPSWRNSTNESSNVDYTMQGRDGPYRILEDSPSANGTKRQSLELRQIGLVKTEARSADVHDMSNDKIHLRIDIEQGYGDHTPKSSRGGGS